MSRTYPPPLNDFYGISDKDKIVNDFDDGSDDTCVHCNLVFISSHHMKNHVNSKCHKSGTRDLTLGQQSIMYSYYVAQMCLCCISLILTFSFPMTPQLIMNEPSFNPDTIIVLLRCLTLFSFDS